MEERFDRGSINLAANPNGLTGGGGVEGLLTLCQAKNHFE